MVNEVILLADSDNIANDFEHLLNVPDRVYFLILGSGAAQQALAAAAAPKAEYWRWVIWAKNPGPIYPRLLSLKLRPGVLPILAPWSSDILAVSISVNNHICRIVRSESGNVVSPAFILAETYMQP